MAATTNGPNTSGNSSSNGIINYGWTRRHFEFRGGIVCLCLMMLRGLQQKVVPFLEDYQNSIVHSPNITASSRNSNSPTPITASTSHPRRLEYADYETRFPLPPELQTILSSQPPETHAATLHNPQAKFLIMTCHTFDNHTQFEDCGGFSDRLIQIPYYLLLAQQTNRTFLIHYTRPYPLTEYLQPTIHFDWTIPSQYQDDDPRHPFAKELQAYGSRSRKDYMNMRRIVWHKELLLEKAAHDYQHQRAILVNANLVVHHMYKYLREHITSMTMPEYWPGLFRRLFRPSPGLQAVLDTMAQRHDLVAGQYVSAHWRYKYPIKPPNRVVWFTQLRDQKETGLNRKDPHAQATRNIYAIAENAINCALYASVQNHVHNNNNNNHNQSLLLFNTTTRASPIHTVYFAADAHEPIDYLSHNSTFAQAAQRVREGELSVTTTISSNTTFGGNITSATNAMSPQKGQQHVTLHIPRIVSRLNAQEEPAHFDSNNPLLLTGAARFYSVFSDFWILAHARCAVMGPGGYARMAARVAGNADECAIRAWPHQGLRVHGEEEEGEKEKVRMCPVYLNHWESMSVETPRVVPV